MHHDGGFSAELKAQQTWPRRTKGGKVTAYKTVFSIAAISLATVWLGCTRASPSPVPQTPPPAISTIGEYRPLDSFLEDNTTHLRFHRADGHVTFRHGGSPVFVQIDGTSKITMVVRRERVSAFRLDLYMATSRDLSPGDIIEVTIEGQFPGSPAQLGAVIEDANVFQGIGTSYTQREYMEEVFGSSFGYDHILYTVAVHARATGIE